MPARAMGDDGPAAGDELLKSANLEAGRSGERKEGGGSKWRRRDGANLTPTRECSACGAGGGMVVLSACGPRITGERTEQLGAIPDFPVFVYSCRCYSFTVYFYAWN